MIKLLNKELKLGVPVFFYILPFVFGLLMFIPGWLYFLVPLYFCFVSVPNTLAGYKSQNDLMFSAMMPVTKKDIVKARVVFISILETLHIGAAALFGIVNNILYANMTFLFLRPTIAFWGLCFAMFGIFNLILISMYYKTAYYYGAATIVSIAAAMIFAFIMEMAALFNSSIASVLAPTNAGNMIPQIIIFIAGILIFVILSAISYFIAVKRFERVDI